MAGAPRTLSCLIEAQTWAAELCRSSIISPGSLVWSSRYNSPSCQRTGCTGEGTEWAEAVTLRSGPGEPGLPFFQECHNAFLAVGAVETQVLQGGFGFDGLCIAE